MIRGDGYEVQIRDATLAGDSLEWRPVMFFSLLLTNQGPAIQAWYLRSNGEMAIASANKFRQVGT